MPCTRRRFLDLAAKGTAAALLGGPLGDQLRAAAPERRNVLFIAVDDLRPQLGCYGHKRILSPHIDRLASRGLLFQRAYCQQAVCGATRASLLSGLRPDSSKVHGNSPPLATVHTDLLTLPKHFRRNGYETVSLSKIYHHRGRDDPGGWSRPEWSPKGNWVGRGYLSEKGKAVCRQEAERIGKLRDRALQKAKDRKDAARIRQRFRTGLGPPIDCADVPDNAYPDGVTADRAVEELRRLKDQPFFLAVGFVKPHLPFNAPKKYWDLYRRSEIKLADNPFAPKGAPKLALTNWGELRNYVGVPKSGPVGDDQARELIHGYHACVSYTDALVGRVIDELDRLGLRQRTVIILWGDHGWKLGEHAMWCKHTNFELDTRVPMILSAPGQKSAGRRTDALVEFVDIYPTLCELCGLEMPKHCEGTSMVPLLGDPARKWKSAAFSQYPRGRIMGYSMRTGRWRYTEWVERKTGKAVARELYDHKNDPAENVNVAARAENAETLKELSAMLSKGWRAARPG